eukprot:1143661-Pelagomonas_calceolata.AAC.3
MMCQKSCSDKAKVLIVTNTSAKQSGSLMPVQTQGGGDNPSGETKWRQHSGQSIGLGPGHSRQGLDTYPRAHPTGAKSIPGILRHAWRLIATKAWAGNSNSIHSMLNHAATAHWRKRGTKEKKKYAQA